MGEGPCFPIAHITRRLGERLRSARLIAIDGLPLAGKSTLAELLAAELGLPVLGIDDFYLPPERWPADVAPAFPFPFSRMEEFRAAVQALHREGSCRYRPYDWQAERISDTPRLMAARGPILIEGCGVLDPVLAPLYDLRLFVASDGESLMAAKIARDGDYMAHDWEHLFLPSTALYLETNPAGRADFIVAGRGMPVSPSA